MLKILLETFRLPNIHARGIFEKECLLLEDFGIFKACIAVCDAISVSTGNSKVVSHFA